jgi:hypothetical protein
MTVFGVCDFSAGTKNRKMEPQQKRARSPADAEVQEDTYLASDPPWADIPHRVSALESMYMNKIPKATTPQKVEPDTPQKVEADKAQKVADTDEILNMTDEERLELEKKLAFLEAICETTVGRLKKLESVAASDVLEQGNIMK